MVRTITAEVFICEVCGDKFLDKGTAIRHEKSTGTPKFKIGEEVEGHYQMKEIGAGDICVLSFKVLGIEKKEHQFLYALKPGYGMLMRHCSYGGHMSLSYDEERRFLQIHKDELKKQIILPGSELNPELRFGSAKERPTNKEISEKKQTFRLSNRTLTHVNFPAKEIPTKNLKLPMPNVR